MVNAETLSGGWYKTIYDYLILCNYSGIGSLVLRIGKPRICICTWCFTSSWKKVRPPSKGVLFGYPITSKKRDGIMVNAETLSGGWYKKYFDYLILSHYSLLINENVPICIVVIIICYFQSPKSARMLVFLIPEQEKSPKWRWLNKVHHLTRSFVFLFRCKTL